MLNLNLEHEKIKDKSCYMIKMTIEKNGVVKHYAFEMDGADRISTKRMKRLLDFIKTGYDACCAHIEKEGS